MKVILGITALLGVAIARPHPVNEPHNKIGKRDLTQSIASLVSQFNVKKVDKAALAGAPINEWNAVGDSFAAGAGSNGDGDYLGDSANCLRYKKAYGVQTNEKAGEWPKTVDGDRVFTYGACGGTRIQTMIDNMLRNDPPPEDGSHKNYAPWGHPDISTMTIGGNDVGFADDKLSNAAALINSDEFAEQLLSGIIQAMGFGQQQNGKDPITYQMFINNYVPFWNEVDAGCDTVQWSLLGLGLKGEFLTIDLRKQMNALSTSFNALIGEIATGLADYGAVFVNGWQDSFQGHQFCDPAADSNLASPTSANVNIGREQCSNDFANMDNSADDGSEGSSKVLGTSLFEALFPDEADRNRISTSSNPSGESDVFKDYDSFEKAVFALSDDFFPKTWAKQFHPKGTPLGIQADFNVKAVLNARKGLGTCEVTGTSDGTVLKSDLQAAIDQVKAKTDTDDCTGGGVIPCSIIAQSGTAAIALCTATTGNAESVKCGSLDSILDNIVSTCVGNRNGIDEATAPTGTDGLTLQISRGST